MRITLAEHREMKATILYNYEYVLENIFVSQKLKN